MKRLLPIALAMFVAVLTLSGQNVPGTFTPIQSSLEPLPGCTVAVAGQAQPFIYDITASLLKTCTATNTWSSVSGVGTVTTTGSPAINNLTKFSGASSITNGDLSGDVSTSGGTVTTLANSGVTAGSCGDVTHSCSITVNAKGLVTAQSNNALASSGLVPLESHTASSSTELDFTTCLSATYDHYVINLEYLIPATNATVLEMQMSTNGGSTYDTSTSSYSWGGGWFGSSSASSGFDFGNTSSNGGAVFLSGTTVTIVNTTANGGVSGTIQYNNPLNASSNKHLEYDMTLAFSGSANYYRFAGHGDYLSTTAVNAFRLLFSSGNIATGTARCLGVSH